MHVKVTQAVPFLYLSTQMMATDGGSWVLSVLALDALEKDSGEFTLKSDIMPIGLSTQSIIMTIITSKIIL